MTRRDIHLLLDGEHPRYGARVSHSLYAVIVLAAVVTTVESLPALPQGAQRALGIAEFLVIAVFLVEFLLRLVCAPQPLKYLFSFWGIIDFLASVPAILMLIPNIHTLRTLRIIRLARLLKLLRLGHAYDRIVGAISAVRHELVIVVTMALLAIFLASVGIYNFEHEAQPEVFASIPHSMWWAIATFTTVGYGDVYPVTAGGRLFTGIVLFIGLALVALPAGLLTAALMEQGATGDRKPPKEKEQ